MEIYKLTPADWKKYKDLRLEALLKDPEAFGESHAKAAKRTNEEWQEKMKDAASYIFVARDDEDYVGMAAAFQEKGEKILHIAYVWGVYLREEYRGRGLGKKLMQAVLDEAKKNSEIKKINLNVNTKQTAAVKLYESFGFQIAGTLHKELQINGEYFDEYAMEKLL